MNNYKVGPDTKASHLNISEYNKTLLDEILEYTMMVSIGKEKHPSLNDICAVCKKPDCEFLDK